MKIKDVFIRKTNDDRVLRFDQKGKNWLITLEFDDNRKFGLELKPEMTLDQIIFEVVKFANLLITKVNK